MTFYAAFGSLTASFSAGFSAANAIPASKKLADNAAAIIVLDFLSIIASSFFENSMPFRSQTEFHLERELSHRYRNNQDN